MPRFIVTLIFDVTADNPNAAIRQAKRDAAETDGYEVEVADFDIHRPPLHDPGNERFDVGHLNDVRFGEDGSS
jgi:hypothetical protein